MVWFFKKNKDKNKTEDKKEENLQSEVLPEALPEVAQSEVLPEEAQLEDSQLQDIQPEEIQQDDSHIEEAREELEEQENLQYKVDEIFAEPIPEPAPEVVEEVVVETPVPEEKPLFVEKVAKVEEPAPEVKSSWLSRLTQGLSKSSSKITEGISSVLTKRKLDDDLLQELEEILIMADLGPKTAADLVQKLSKDRFGKDITDEEVKKFLAEGIEEILEPVAIPFIIDSDKKPFVLLMTGVNGAGKTTTIGKLAKKLKEQGKTVLMAAGDTFRAAAVEQLTVWGERSGISVYSKPLGSDAAALAYEAYAKAKEEGYDVLIIDTAGRLQNKTNLMEELQKIVRVLKKHDEDAPHSCLIVLDATTGQNAHSQVEVFKETVNINGIIVTKLDGSAKGGVIVSLANIFKLPVHAIGVGEQIDDLRAFSAKDFALSLMGLNKK